jgi:hypothetical protein
MSDKGRGNWRRTFNRYIGLVAAIAGLSIVVASFFLVGNISLWYLTVMAGLLLAMGGFLYGAHPFLTSERRFTGLRLEVDRFIGLVRDLNTAARPAGSPEEFERVKREMLRSVERMAELAGKEDTAHGLARTGEERSTGERVQTADR